jgi:PAS domain S-box-containing protein
MSKTDPQSLEAELARLRQLKENLKAGYRETFEHAGVGIAHVSPTGAFLEANTRFCEMMGLAPEALSSIRFQDITYRDDVDRNLSMLQSLLQGEIPGYRIQKRYVRSSGELLWADLTVSAVRGEDGKPLKLISIVNDITRQKADEERLRFLMGELSHRTKNLITIVQAIVNQTCAAHTSSEEIRRVLLDRLSGIAASQEALIVHNGGTARMRELVELQMEVFLERTDPRITLKGPDVELCASAVRAIGMALHELATNAFKYGSLSTAEGRVVITWSVDMTETPTFHVCWSEHDGPVVKPPTRRGFGRLVVENMVATSTGGRVELAFEPEGITWTLHAPWSTVRA